PSLDKTAAAATSISLTEFLCQFVQAVIFCTTVSRSTSYYVAAMRWGHGAVQRALLAELQKQQQAIDTMSLLRIICDGNDPTHAQGQSGRRALRVLAREGAVIARRSSAGLLFWQITHTGHC